jgi:hypothetical protein
MKLAHAALAVSLVLLSFAAPARAAVECTPFGPNGVQRCVAGLPSPVADTIMAYQKQSQWCWAASISMVFHHHGLTVSQQEIVKQAWGTLVNMPAQPQDIARSLNRDWVDARGTRWRVATSTLTADPATAARDLAAGRPLIIGTMGHAMVLTALTYDRAVDGSGQVVLATVRDPWPGNGGRRDLSAQEWISTMLLTSIEVRRVSDGAGDRAGRGEPRCRTVTAPCTPPAHPNGDLSPCAHAMHPLGDLIACSHPCMDPYYGTVPCHPQGDVIPCSHPAHPMGDVSPCQHALHPLGDRREVCE